VANTRTPEPARRRAIAAPIPFRRETPVTIATGAVAPAATGKVNSTPSSSMERLRAGQSARFDYPPWRLVAEYERTNV